MDKNVFETISYYSANLAYYAIYEPKSANNASAVLVGMLLLADTMFNEEEIKEAVFDGFNSYLDSNDFIYSVMEYTKQNVYNFLGINAKLKKMTEEE